MGWMYYYDYYFLILVVPALLISLAAQIIVKTTFSKQSKKLSARGISGAQAASNILSYYGITNVRIERVSGNLTDHYDPKTNVIRLSDNVFSSTSIAAIGVACHEAGHAAQHANNYLPIKIRNAIIPVCNIGSTVGLPLAIIGYFLGFEPLVTVGLLLYALIAVFQLVTLPVEINASRRAMVMLREQAILGDQELNMTRKVLTAAALTYVAGAASAILQLLRIILLFGGRDDRD